MNNTTYVQLYAKSLIDKDSICVDMTMGNGNDTLFLCRLSKKVYAFDISKKAIENTKKRLKDYDNYELIHDSHSNIDKYIGYFQLNS
ncbi:MAG: class I SAM-dependent methyltransferase [Erysipelotrichaceae bacterium]|nr:class I SAM-dependent methyltransferase [Erysipelotrichaceae bacterium]